MLSALRLLLTFTCIVGEKVTLAHLLVTIVILLAPEAKVCGHSYYMGWGPLTNNGQVVFCCDASYKQFSLTDVLRNKIFTTVLVSLYKHYSSSTPHHHSSSSLTMYPIHLPPGSSQCIVFHILMKAFGVCLFGFCLGYIIFWLALFWQVTKPSHLSWEGWLLSYFKNRYYLQGRVGSVV